MVELSSTQMNGHTHTNGHTNGVAKKAVKQPQSQKQPTATAQQSSSAASSPVSASQAAADVDDASIKKKKKKNKKKKSAVAAVEVESSDDAEEAAPAEDDEEDDGEDVPAAASIPASRQSKSSSSSSHPSTSSNSKSSFHPSSMHFRPSASKYDSSRYPKSAPGQNPHPKVPFFTALSTYFAYGLLIAVGHFRDFLNRWGFLRTVKSSPHLSNPQTTLGPLVSDFDDFYTRRLYHRIEHAWNRPIDSCPASVMSLCLRAREGYGEPLKLTGKTENVLNLGSYNYLGFGDPNSATKGDVFEALDQYGVCTTSTRVNLGTTKLHAELEELVAYFVGKEAAMIFGMGFATNSTGIPSLVGKGGLIISDANNHSSIAAGARSSGAVIRVFKHNDVVSLEAVLRHALIQGQPKTHRPWTKILIIIEGIYSMEGEICPLKEIVALKKKYGAYLFVDEAHSIGAIGANGRGICEYSGIPPSDVDILMGTFTKSFGAVGGYIAADKNVVEFLRSNSAGSVYSCSISPPAVQQVLSAFKIMLHADGTTIGRTKLDSLRENSNYFRKRLIDMGCHVLGDWDSPIVLLMLYHPAKITAFSQECLKRGLAIVVVGFPATPLLLARVRFCLSAGHTREQLDYALMQIEDVADLMGVKYMKQQI